MSKKHCSLCLSAQVKKDGFYTNGRQRWFCLSCKHSFSWQNLKCKQSNEQSWFRRWVVEGDSVRQLSALSGHGRAKINRIINYWLSQSPPIISTNLTQRFLIFDGTFLHRPQSIATLMDAQTNTVVSGQYGISESSARELIDFFSPLVDRGLNPTSYTVDGNPQVIKVLTTLWPNITIQRCLVHIQRQGLSWCRRNPKIAYSRKLRDIFLKVTYIHTKEERDQFLEMVREWEEKYGQYIHISSDRGRVFSDIKRARSMLLKALPDMFHYLDESSIPTSTNGLEGYFSRLKDHYRRHRGLSKEKLGQYFNWYFFFTLK
jgi:hypothetical protein